MAMNPQVKHLRRLLRAALCAIFFCGNLAAAAAEPQPDAQEILRNIRINQSAQHRVLHGRLRTGGTVIPFRLVLNGNEIRYEFPDGAIVLRLGENGSQLFEETKSGSQKVSPARFDAPVRGTDITYEDLALKFLYWPRTKIEGEETKLAQKCWKLHLEPASSGDSQYATVLLWAAKRGGEFLQAEGYDRSGQIMKRFKVVSGQRDPVTGGWMLKQMRIEQLAGAGSRDRAPTYLEIEK